MRLTLLPMLIFLLPTLPAQTPPPCDVPYIHIAGIEFSGNISLRFVELPDNAASVEIRHRFFFEEGDTMIHNFNFIDPPEIVELPFDLFAPWHEFTTLSICENGETHFGSTFFIESRQQDVSPECPAPTGLVINSLDNDNVSFGWDFSDFAQLYHITYSPVGGNAQEFDNQEPFHQQPLEDVTLHWFEIYNICDTTLFAPALLRSPSIQFLIVSVDDIKALECGPGLDSLKNKKSLMIRFSAHGNFNTNKDSFFNFHDSLCLIDPIREVALEDLIDIRISPNPFSYEFLVELEAEQISISEIRLHDLRGKLLHSQLPEPGAGLQNLQFAFPAPNLPEGLYLLEVQTNRGILAKKIVKMHSLH